MKRFKRMPLEYRTGINELDKQHSSIVRTLEELILTIGDKGSDDSTALISLIQDVYAYSKNHLAYEEELMKKVNYPGLNDHLAQHAIFRAKLKDIIHTEDSPEEVLRDAAEFLKDWFLKHICNVDFKFAEFYREQHDKGAA